MSVAKKILLELALLALTAVPIFADPSTLIVDPETLVMPVGGGYVHTFNCKSVKGKKIILYSPSKKQMITGVCSQCRAIPTETSQAPSRNYSRDRNNYTRSNYGDPRNTYASSRANNDFYQMTEQEKLKAEQEKARAQCFENGRRQRMERQLKEIEDQRRWDVQQANYKNSQPVYNRNSNTIYYNNGYQYESDRYTDAMRANEEIRSINEAARSNREAVLRSYGK